MKVEPIPQGYGAVTPFIIVKGAAQLLDFMRDAFGAEEMGGSWARTVRSVMPKPGSATRSS